MLRPRRRPNDTVPPSHDTSDAYGGSPFDAVPAITLELIRRRVPPQEGKRILARAQKYLQYKENGVENPKQWLFNMVTTLLDDEGWG